MKALALLLLGFYITSFANAITHANKEIELIHSGDTRGCYMFTLKDLAVADESVPNGRKWFAILHTHEAAKEIFSMVLAAKTSGAKVQVKTNNAEACDGHVAVRNFLLL